MARRVNAKCQQCAALSAEEAIVLHGPTGDNCWNPANENGWGYDCHRRRSHYRHRDDQNRTRRRLRRLAASEGNNLESQPVSWDSVRVTLPAPPLPYAAVLVLYRNHKDAPVHAVGAEIWQGDRQRLQIPPTHCMGMRGNQVTAYIQTVLEQLHEQFGVSRFEDVIKQLPVTECPIHPCPLKTRSEVEQDA
jgi:hypothetical protein